MSAKRFSKDELYSKIYSLNKKDKMKYPANGYNTLQTAKRLLQEYADRDYTDRAISKTHREITRIK